jgi:hypothetical protein
VIGFFLLVISSLVFFWRSFHQWSRTIFVLTDRRIIDIEQKGFFDRVVTETVYPQIDEVNYRMKGLWSTLFRYGTIRLHLEGSAADIEFEHVRTPAKIHDLINDLRRDR